MTEMESGRPREERENERRVQVESQAEFDLRAEYVILHYMADHPEWELTKMVKEGLISHERAYRTLLQQARDPKTDVQRPDVLPYVMDYEMMIRREDQQPLTIGVYDIDHFKLVNTELDHTGGDAVLRRGAEIMARSIRQDDVTRWGGEEFVIVYPNTRKDDAIIPAERLRNSFELELADVRPNGQPITISGGLVEYDPARHTKYEDLLKEGSQTVLAAKEAGRNRILTELPEAKAA